MTERDPLIDAIHAAGDVPPPPDRDAAFARAMKPVLMPSRRGLSRSFIALFAAALLAAPAAVFAAHTTHTHAAVDTPIVSERPDPGSSIHSETDDATLKRQLSRLQEVEHQSVGTTSSEDHGGVISGGTDDRSGPGPSPSVSDDTSNSGPGGADDHPTVSPTPTASTGSGSGDVSISPSSGSSDGSPSGPH
jgi:hypothetical protein